MYTASFFFNDTATTEIYTLSLHDALPICSRLFFAHVRASTGTSTTRANCHPFSHGRFLFMHNGQIGGYARIKRRIEALIPDELYDARLGTTDSEALFLASVANGLEADPIGADRKSVV